MARLFVSQDQMDRWTAAGKVRLDDDVMTLPALGRSFKLRSAVYFAHTVDGPDEHRLLGRVKTEEQLAEMHAEHYGASVIMGDIGYECEEGFVGVPVEGVGAGGASGLLRLGD
jgi:hypothetical protein